MPKRVELRIGEVSSIGGVPMTLAYTQGKYAAIVVAEYDDEGLVDASPCLLTAASLWRRRFDRRSGSVNDIGNSGSV